MKTTISHVVIKDWCRLVLIIMLWMMPCGIIGDGCTSASESNEKTIKRLVFVGDSITYGVGVENREIDRYSAVTTSLLRTKHPMIQEINLGESGRALCQQPDTYAEKILEKKPDAVVIQWGVNDQYWGFSVSAFIVRYEQLVRALRQAKYDMPIVIMTLVADFRRKENMDLWIGEANVAIQELAARYNCHVAYVHRAIDHKREMYNDCIHPNNAGAETMAKAIVRALENPPLSSENLKVQFDQGPEIRFLQNVFIPRHGDDFPQWISVENINRSGMQIETKVPLSIRTAPIYAQGTYMVSIKNESGFLIKAIKVEVGWQQMVSFFLNPKEHKGPFFIEIKPAQTSIGNTRKIS